MGTVKESTSGSQNTQVNQTAEEKAMNRLRLEQYQQFEPGQTEMYKNAFNLGNQLLTSFGSKGSDMWQSLIGGVTNEQQQRMISEQQRMLNPQFQASGLMDSGLAYTASLRAATDLANQNAQFNVGALQNALNLALSGQAQVQSPALGATSSLGSQLAGLRGTSGNISGQKTNNPFLSSFYSSLGNLSGQGVKSAAGMIGGGMVTPGGFL